MQSSRQRRRLLTAMNAEPVHAWLVLVRCAAGLTVIVLLSLIGVRASIDPGAPRHVAARAAPHAGQLVQKHRKQMFDERRARFERGGDRHSIAGEVREAGYELPLALR